MLDGKRDWQEICSLGKVDEGSGPNKTAIASKIERDCWPIKISNSGIGSWIVPIKAYWARKLFDRHSQGELFGVDPSRILSYENVYYSKSLMKLKAGDRILWYITEEPNGLESKQIRACSKLISKEPMLAKDAFKKFERLGVYEWKDLMKMTNDDQKAKINAFLFANTECFNQPIHLDEIKELCRNIVLQAPSKIDEDKFFKLYKKGKKKNS